MASITHLNYPFVRNYITLNLLNLFKPKSEVMLSPDIIKNAEKAIAEARETNFRNKGYNIYWDERCKTPDEFIMEKTDGSELLVSYDSVTNTFTELTRLVTANA